MMYGIVYSDTTGIKWPNALRGLKEKYERKWPGEVYDIKYSSDVNSCLSDLCQYRPAYTCFLTHYEECFAEFVASVHKLTRQIDPATSFTDTIWGILTGLTEEDVLFAISQDSLTVHRVLGGTPVDLSKFESGSWYSEGEPCASFHRSKLETETHKEKCPQDTTTILVQELSAERNIETDSGVDMMITSGHATEKDWNIGYSYSNGRFICQSTIMCGQAMDGNIYPISHNGQPKILSAAGNCLMGKIPESNCMALAWMHSVGVVQMTGYLVPTWFGYGGWGVHDYFINLPGALSFAESFFANHQSLLAELHMKYSLHETKSFDEYGDGDKECLGLLYDRDYVAFYGDPAFEAKLVRKVDEQLYNLKVSEISSDSEWKTFEITLTAKSGFGRSPVYIFPRTVSKYKVLEGNAIITCRCIILYGTCTAGETRRVVYAIQ